MNRRLLTAALTLLCVSANASPHQAVASSPVPAASATAQETSRAAPARGASLVASRTQVVEGDRYSIVARIRSPRSALTVTLQKFNPPNYSFESSSWDTVRTVKVRARSKITFPVVAVEPINEKYRATVTYNVGPRATSNTAAVTVWRWVPLENYNPNYEAETFAAGDLTTTINGRAYRGWGALSYSHTGAWESRFTPGRHCIAFRGVLGLADISADDSTGTIAFTADDRLTYTSPTLTPGMALPVTIPLTTRPYRFGIRLTDTTPGGTTSRDEIEAWPVIGDPALLCSGV